MMFEVIEINAVVVHLKVEKIVICDSKIILKANKNKNIG